MANILLGSLYLSLELDTGMEGRGCSFSTHLSLSQRGLQGFIQGFRLPRDINQLVPQGYILLEDIYQLVSQGNILFKDIYLSRSFSRLHLIQEYLSSCSSRLYLIQGYLWMYPSRLHYSMIFIDIHKIWHLFKHFWLIFL